MTPIDLLVLSLFAWYLAYVLIKTHGPFGVFARLRNVTTLGGLLTCIWCLILWTAALGYVLTQTPLIPLVYIGGAAGLGMIGHRYTGGDF